MMNLLAYTKKLYEKINFYDKIIKNKNFPTNISNPFAAKQPVNLTIIWVEDEYHNN